MGATTKTKHGYVAGLIAYNSACVVANASGITSVATGLSSPQFGIATPKTSSSRNLRGIRGCYYTACGSRIHFQWFSTTQTGASEAPINASVIAFNWIAFEQ